MPCPAASTLFIFMLSFSTNINNIQFQKFTHNFQVYFSVCIVSEYFGHRHSILTQSWFWFGEGSLDTRLTKYCYTELGTIFTFLSRDCNDEWKIGKKIFRNHLHYWLLASGNSLVQDVSSPCYLKKILTPKSNYVFWTSAVVILVLVIMTDGTWQMNRWNLILQLVSIYLLFI